MDPDAAPGANLPGRDLGSTAFRAAVGEKLLLPEAGEPAPHDGSGGETLFHGIRHPKRDQLLCLRGAGNDVFPEEFRRGASGGHVPLDLHRAGGECANRLDGPGHHPRVGLCLHRHLHREGIGETFPDLAFPAPDDDGPPSAAFTGEVITDIHGDSFGLLRPEPLHDRGNDVLRCHYIGFSFGRCIGGEDFREEEHEELGIACDAEFLRGEGVDGADLSQGHADEGLRIGMNRGLAAGKFSFHGFHLQRAVFDCGLPFAATLAGRLITNRDVHLFRLFRLEALRHRCENVRDGRSKIFSHGSPPANPALFRASSAPSRMFRQNPRRGRDAPLS